MNLLSNTLIYNISTKLKIDFVYLKNENFYLFNLSKNINNLLESNINNFQTQNLCNGITNTERNKKELKQDCVICYIVTITFLKTSIMIHLSDAVGNIKWFSSSGSINVTNSKRKRRKRTIVFKLIFRLLKELRYHDVNDKPVALHLNDVSTFRFSIVKKLRKIFFIKIIKIFHKLPYNGCRQKKIPRKKRSKIFK